ncbi:hypothetical protein ACOZ4B_20700 (plasmid) [Haloferax prahovense]|uniref:hypothetical protein n=1 Tax=Haloferax prahovense TaxID=381852 RepID=UPI003C76E77D
MFAHQTEMHPLLQQQLLLEHAQRHDYWVVTYRLIVGGDVMMVPTLVDISEKYDATPTR